MLKTLCVTGARCWPSSIFSQAANARSSFLDDLSSQQNDLQLHSIAHGVVMLEQVAIDYGAETAPPSRDQDARHPIPRRATMISSSRRAALKFTRGWSPLSTIKPFANELTSSGNPELDKLLGGGLERGTNALLIGSAGVGKSSLALTYALAAAARGEHAVFFAFDEGRGTVEARARTLGLPLQQYLNSGLIRFQQIDPAEMAPGAFAANVQHSVETDGARLVVIDSLNGYLNAMPDERFLLLQMHELLSYLAQQGVLTILVLAQHGLVGPMETPLDISYLSDSVLMLRYFEVGGVVRRALSVVKKRSGNHEHTIREFKLSSEGISVGPPLTNFSGIFSGTPRYIGEGTPLMARS